MSRTIGAGTVSFVWDQNAGLPVILEDSGGNRFVYGLDLIATIDASDNEEYHLADGLGSTTSIADDAGDVVATYEYDAFGNLRSETGSSANEFTYAGEQVDGTGLQYLRARYYDPATGRFLSRDPVPFLNRYVYANNNPVMLTDPSGELAATTTLVAYTLAVLVSSYFLAEALSDCSLLHAYDNDVTECRPIAEQIEQLEFPQFVQDIRETVNFSDGGSEAGLSGGDTGLSVDEEA